MNLFKKVLSIALTIILVLSSVSIIAVAADDDYIFTPSASFVASGVTRVAAGSNSLCSRNENSCSNPFWYP